jgi:hypothetical protein
MMCENELLIYLICGLIIGYLFYFCIGFPDGCGNPPLINITNPHLCLKDGMIFIPILGTKKFIHFHHWVFFIFVILFLYFNNLKNGPSCIIYGISFMGIIQGLSMPDWNSFIEEIPIKKHKD